MNSAEYPEDGLEPSRRTLATSHLGDVTFTSLVGITARTMASTNLKRASKGRSRLPEATTGLNHPTIRLVRRQPRYHNKGAQGSIRRAKQNGTFSHETSHLGEKPWQSKSQPKHGNHPAFTYRLALSQGRVPETTNYRLTQGGPTRGLPFNDMTTQGQQRILLEPSTVVDMTERNRKYPESRFAMKRAQDVGPAANSNRHTRVRMKNQASKRTANYYLKNT